MPYAKTFFRTNDPMVAMNAELLLEWKVSECERITNAHSAPDFFMHKHNAEVSLQTWIVDSVHTEPQYLTAQNHSIVWQ